MPSAALAFRRASKPSSEMSPVLGCRQGGVDSGELDR